jgi:hypothetical protein
MTIRKATTAAAVTGVLALATGGAYALGTQADDGSAAAASGSSARPAFAGHPPGPDRAGFGLDRLADRLGVDQDKLRDALEDLRPDLGGPGHPPGGPGQQFSKDLADALGTTQAKVEAALKKVRDKYEKQAKAQRDEFAQKLADKLGIDVSKVKKAFDGPAHFGFGFRGHPGP